MIADYEGDLSAMLNPNIDTEIPILATRNLVLFPGIIMPILVGRPASLRLLGEMSKDENSTFALFCQKDADNDNPMGDDIYETGVYAKVLRVLDIPDNSGNKTALVQGLCRCRLTSITAIDPYMRGYVEAIPETGIKKGDKEYDTAFEYLQSETPTYI